MSRLTDVFGDSAVVAEDLRKARNSLEEDGLFGYSYRLGEAADHIESLYAEALKMQAELERIQTAAKRYETVRTLNPREFAELTAKNLETGTPFDDLVDELARGGQV